MADSHIATGPTLAAAPRRGPAPDDPMSEMLPDRLVEGDAVGDYVIERFLGAGAMGDVYAGRHPVIGKKVAVKVLKRELAADKEASERFVREAKAVNQIDHPNVIDVFNFGQLKGDDGRLFLVMDLVDGKSLRKVLEDGPLELGEALDILDKIADALDAAHARGVIHRDLKPDNVMLSADRSKVFVLDFGIAKLFSATQSASGNGTLTGKGSWLGTPGYMAPEQWSAEGASPASDRYALGVMAYELLSGVLPFKAPTLPQMMEQHFRAKVPALSERGTARRFEHAQTLDPVLARAMAKSPDDRFASARALVEALRAASQGKKVVAPGSKRNLTMPAIAGVSVLGLGIVGALVIRGGDDAADPRERPNAAIPAEDGKVKIALEVITRPPDASVMRDGVKIGQTPFKIEVDAAAKSTLTISKPGYRAISDSIAFDHPVTITKDLQPILGFEGVWAMPDGKLRGFWRTGTDKIEVYRLESVTGDRELWRTCQLIAAPAGRDLVMFTTTAEMTDERAHHGEAGCSNPHGIEYTFDPAEETLAVRVERIETSRRDGHCEVVSKKWGPSRMLTRADRGHGETRFTEPPVGVPDKRNVKDLVQPVKTDNVGNDEVFDGKKKPTKVPPSDIKSSLNNAPAKPLPKPVSKPAPDDFGKQKETDLAPQVPSEPQQKLAPPTKKSKAAAEPIQKSETPAKPVPQAQAPLRGDSQAAK